jgi:beta-glucosidase
LAHQITQDAIVLLKNQNSLLPLDKSKLKSIAVVGQRSNDVRVQKTIRVNNVGM